VILFSVPDAVRGAVADLVTEAQAIAVAVEEFIVVPLPVVVEPEPFEPQPTNKKRPRERNIALSGTNFDDLCFACMENSASFAVI
jgi:hypothetical protein